MRRQSPIVYAHRGANLERPENSLEAFRVALEAGADAIETDAHLTRDGRVVLCHDPTGARMAGVSRAVQDLTLTELREWNVGARFVDRAGGAPYAKGRIRMPTMDEALREFPDAFFNVDAKSVDRAMVASLVRVVRAARAQERVRIASFSTANLRRARALGYEGPIGLSAAEVALLMLAPMPMARAFRFGGDAAQVPPRSHGVAFATQKAIDRMHRLGLRMDFWTIDDADEARRLVAMGADGIVTNDPRTIASALRRL